MRIKVQRLEAELAEKDALIVERESHITAMEAAASELEDKICCLSQENEELKSQSAFGLAEGKFSVNCKQFLGEYFLL